MTPSFGTRLGVIPPVKWRFDFELRTAENLLYTECCGLRNHDNVMHAIKSDRNRAYKLNRNGLYGFCKIGRFFVD